jgi:endonuclease/exonuclease/phosphatase (EEP) superfamily protein YafD
MTYNLNFGNPDHTATADAIAREDADIVLLQEITNDWRSDLEARFAKQYPHRSYQVQRRAAGGLAVLSKHPITSDDLWSPPRGGWFPASRLIIDSPFGALQILNVHLRPNLDGGSWVRGWHTTPSIRRREIEAYWKKIHYDLPTIVAGDFNDLPDGKAIAYLANHGMKRVATEGPTTWHYETVMDGVRKSLLSLDIDHVMIDSHLSARNARVLDAGASDHRPVVVTLAPR